MPKVSLSKTILLTAGAAVGALLFAPKSGKELRQDLKVEGKKLAHTAQDRAVDLKEDFKESYAEAQREVENEKEELDNRQKRLENTIREIEADLNSNQTDNLDLPNDRLAATAESVEREVDLGNVNNTTLEPTEDEVVPKGELQNALEDNNLENKSEFTNNQNDRSTNNKENVSGNVHNTSEEPTDDQAIPSDKLDEALEDNHLENDPNFDINQ